MTGGKTSGTGGPLITGVVVVSGGRMIGGVPVSPGKEPGWPGTGGWKPPGPPPLKNGPTSERGAAAAVTVSRGAGARVEASMGLPTAAGGAAGPASSASKVSAVSGGAAPGASDYNVTSREGQAIGFRIMFTGVA